MARTLELLLAVSQFGVQPGVQTEVSAADSDLRTGRCERSDPELVFPFVGHRIDRIVGSRPDLKLRWRFAAWKHESCRAQVQIPVIPRSPPMLRQRNSRAANSAEAIKDRFPQRTRSKQAILIARTVVTPARLRRAGAGSPALAAANCYRHRRCITGSVRATALAAAAPNLPSRTAFSMSSTVDAAAAATRPLVQHSLNRGGPQRVARNGAAAALRRRLHAAGTDRRHDVFVEDGLKPGCSGLGPGAAAGGRGQQVRRCRSRGTQLRGEALRQPF